MIKMDHGPSSSHTHSWYSNILVVIAVDRADIALQISPCRKINLENFAEKNCQGLNASWQ